MASSDPSVPSDSSVPSTPSAPSDSPSPEQQPRPLLSIVAEPPPNTKGPLPNIFIDSVLDRLMNSGANRGVNQVKRAYSTAKLHKVVSDFLKDKSSQIDVQIIGHSVAGFVGLGESWAGEYIVNFDFLALDSNPGLLVNLADFRGKFNTVTLAGCNVGDQTSRTRSMGGDVLLFALEELWNCPVFGATGRIDFSNFNESSGAFGGHSRRWSEDMPTEPVLVDSSENVTRISGLLSIDALPPGPGVSFQDLTSSRAWNSAYSNASRLPISSELSNLLVSTYRHQQNVGAGLATPEFVFDIRTASLGSSLDGVAWISLDGRCLTLQFGEDLPVAVHGSYHYQDGNYYQHYFADDARLDVLLSALRALLGNQQQQPATVAA
jgi:hypothetical protein